MKNITVLIDTNIFIDVLQDRIPFTDNSQAVIGLVTQKKIKGAVAAHSITNLWYILRKPILMKSAETISFPSLNYLMWFQ